MEIFWIPFLLNKFHRKKCGDNRLYNIYFEDNLYIQQCGDNCLYICIKIFKSKFCTELIW